MADRMLKVNILAIVVSGLIMFLTGGGLYLFKGFISNHIRYFLPTPPLAVAAYVFVFNMFKHYEGDLPAENGKILSELIFSTLTAAIIFGVFTLLLIVIINVAKKYM